MAKFDRPRLALDIGMNHPPVRVEHAHGDGVGRPVQIGHKRNGAVSASSVGDQFANHGRRRIEARSARPTLALLGRREVRDDWLANRVADGHPEVGLSSSSVRGR
jgi:hypothetical protein